MRSQAQGILALDFFSTDLLNGTAVAASCWTGPWRGISGTPMIMLREYRPAPFPYVPAAVLLDHEYVCACGCGRGRQVGGEPGQLAERPG
jgi:hypothetical protein